MLADNIFALDIEAPRVAAAALPGQFVIVRVDDKGERIPLTISDYDRQKGTVEVVIQVIGVSTRKIYALQQGDSLADFVGPLGRPSDFVNEPIEELAKQHYLFIAGGVGTAPVYPQVRWLSEHGIDADVIIGAKSEKMLILTDKMRSVASNLYIATDDGSTGFKGLVTDCMKELIDVKGKHYDTVVAIGPMIMMKFVALATLPYGIHTVVSLNSIMVDGTGMCGACRVSVGGKMRFTCVEGPEFDAHQVDFDEAMRRQAMYRTEEHEALDRYNSEHECRCGINR